MKKIKIALSLILAIALTSIMVLPAFAAGTTCNCGHAPVIQVRGIGETLYDENGNEIFSTENILNAILPVLPQLGQFVTDTTNVELFVGSVETAVKTIFAPVMYNANGERTSVVKVECNNAPVEDYMDFNADLTEEGKLSKALYDELGDDHVYFFTYDWTGDPVQIVKDLKAFIDSVKDQSGHKKVSINAESMGGAVVNLYLDTYGQSDIYNLVMANSAFNGLEMLGQLFTGNVEIDAKALTYLIGQEVLGNVEYAELVPYIPVLEQLIPTINELMKNEAVKAMIYSRIFRPVFGYMASFWLLVPGYSFDDAKDFMFGVDKNANNLFASESRDGVGSNLLKIINKVGNASKNTDAMVDKLVNGYSVLGYQVTAPINFYANVTNYNRYIAPVTPSANWNSDGVIEVYNTSGFAVAADMGYTLGENYVQQNFKDKNYISPDKVIDASTCQAPNNTWFIKNLGHVSYGLEDGVADFYVWLLTATEKQTINSNPEYPQFMYYNTLTSELMTWEEKAENDILGGIPLPSLPNIDLEGLEEALNQILKGLEDMGLNLDDLGNLDIGSIGNLLGGFDLGSIGDLLGGFDISMITGLLGSLGDLLGGLLGGGGSAGGEETPVPEGGDEGGLGDEPTTDAPSTDSDGNNNIGNSGSSNINRAPAQNTGLVLSGTPVFSSGSSTWIILFMVAAVIAGILIIKL
ncbi:MAG: alpha/beta hydrolase [Clostridia bacterium]|nr:alpha/beta hydrolase [Clostridia bacterium]